MTARPKTYNKIINSKEYQEFFNKFSDFATNNIESTLRALKEKTNERYDIIATTIMHDIKNIFWTIEEDLEIEEEREENNA